MKTALTIALAALCGFVIAIATTPRPIPATGETPEAETMPDNQFELLSMQMVISECKRLLAARRDEAKMLQALVRRARMLPKPSERKN